MESHDSENKHSSKEKQMSIGRKKFNMDPKKGEPSFFDFYNSIAPVQTREQFFFWCLLVNHSQLMSNLCAQGIVKSQHRLSRLLNNKLFPSSDSFFVLLSSQVSNIFTRIICWKLTNRMWRSFSTKAKDSTRQQSVRVEKYEKRRETVIWCGFSFLSFKGDYLGEKKPFNEKVLKAFVELHDFTNLILVQALR